MPECRVVEMFRVYAFRGTGRGVEVGWTKTATEMAPWRLSLDPGKVALSG